MALGRLALATINRKPAILKTRVATLAAMSDTPRTDAEAWQGFARQLERELNVALDEKKALEERMAKCDADVVSVMLDELAHALGTVEAERDNARDQLAAERKAREEAERLLRNWMNAYPDFAQLMDGFKAGEMGNPDGNWSAWDQMVRDKLMALGVETSAALQREGEKE
jgi:hypothetical protein